MNNPAPRSAGKDRPFPMERDQEIGDRSRSPFSPSVKKPTFRDRCERWSILKALQQLPRESSVLELPCGSGRLTPLLVAQGLRVTGADISPDKVSLAHENWERIRGEFPLPDQRIPFEVRDALQTKYAEDQFDAVFCSRLLHRISDPDTRRTILSELGRISRGPVIVSFLNSFAVDCWRGSFSSEGDEEASATFFPISMESFRQEIGEAGFRVEASSSVLWGISGMWYMVLENRSEEPRRSIPGPGFTEMSDASARRAA